MILVAEMIMLVLIVYMLFMVISLKMGEDENMISPYECGFDPSGGSRMSFSYRFFLISILFLVFDVEITLMLPLPYEDCSTYSAMGFFVFVFVMMGGLVYEYFNGVLSWIV